MKRTALTFATVFLLLVFAAGGFLTKPANQVVPLPVSILDIEPVKIAYGKNQIISGWFRQGLSGRGSVLLLHGNRGNKSHMLGRANFLKRLGYTTLSIDLPSHGESTGERIAFGLREARAIEAAVAYLRSIGPATKIGVIGVSLGAASTVFADFETPPDAVILESMYPTIEDAIVSRLEMRIGQLAAVASPLLLWQIPLRYDFSTQTVRPIERVSQLRSPVLIISGQKDLHTKQIETERIFARAREPKQLWIVGGASHVDLHGFAPAEYERKIAVFLENYLAQ
jgi:uncharacterized protein